MFETLGHLLGCSNLRAFGLAFIFYYCKNENTCRHSKTTWKPKGAQCVGAWRFKFCRWFGGGCYRKQRRRVYTLKPCRIRALAFKWCGKLGTVQPRRWRSHIRWRHRRGTLHTFRTQKNQKRTAQTQQKRGTARHSSPRTVPSVPKNFGANIKLLLRGRGCLRLQK